MIDFKESQQTIDFDFDYWMELAKKDPDTFEKKRKSLMQITINEAPKKMHRRLNGLQWSIDSNVKTAKNSMDGCLKIYQMMLDSVYEDGGLLEALRMTNSAEKEIRVENVVKMRTSFEIEK